MRTIVSAKMNGKDDVINWYLDGNGNLYINGKGRMPDFSCGGNPEPPWDRYKDKIIHLSVAEGISEVGIKAFSSCKNLETVYLSSSVRVIANNAFYNCSRLSEMITEDEGAEFHYIYEPKLEEDQSTGHRQIRFGVGSFYNVPWALNQWGDYYVLDGTLYCCLSNSESLTLPSDIRVIHGLSFKDTNVKQLELPDSLERICELAFADSQVRSLFIPENVIDIEDYAFVSSKLEQIEFSRKCKFKPTEGTFMHSEFQYVQVKGNRKVPNLYELSEVRDEENYGEFQILNLHKKRPTYKENNELETGVYGAYYTINIGKEIYRRIINGCAILKVEFKEDIVKCVKSYTWNETFESVEEHLIYLCVSNGMIDILRDTVTPFYEFFYYFPGYRDPAQMIQKGILRKPTTDNQEAWFCLEHYKNEYKYQELKLLIYWMKNHPNMSVDVAEENISEYA